MAVATPHVEPTTLGMIDVEENVRRQATNLDSLIASINEHGLLQPPTVRRKEDGRFLLISGHRRLEALKAIAGKGWRKAPVPVNVLRGDDAEKDLERQLAENVVREGMDPFDEADAFKQACERGRSVKDVALAFGTDETHVKKRLQVANLLPEFRDLARAGKMGMAAAAKLASMPGPDQAQLIAPVLEKAKSGAVQDWEVKGLLRVKSADASHALFDLAASGISVNRDLFDPSDQGRIVDVDRFLELQRAALDERKAAYLAMGVPFVEIVDRAKGDVRDPKELGVVYWGDGALPPLHATPAPARGEADEGDGPGGGESLGEDDPGVQAFLEEATAEAIANGMGEEEALAEARRQLDEMRASDARDAAAAREKDLRARGVVFVLHGSGQVERFRVATKEPRPEAAKGGTKSKEAPGSFYQLQGDLWRLHAADVLARNPQLAIAVAILVLAKPGAFTGLTGNRNRVLERVAGREDSPAVRHLTAVLQDIGRWLARTGKQDAEDDEPMWNPERWGGLYGWNGRDVEAVLDRHGLRLDELASMLGAILGTYLTDAKLVSAIRAREAPGDIERRIVMAGEELRKLPGPIFVEQAAAIGFKLRRKATKAENVDALVKACAARMAETGEAPIIPLLKEPWELPEAIAAEASSPAPAPEEAMVPAAVPLPEDDRLDLGAMA